MDNLNYDTSCKYEVLAEISFHADTTKNEFVKLLCSRLLARCYLNKLDTKCIEPSLVSNEEDECSIVQKQFTNLSTNESQQHAEWYAYWEKNGEHFVNEAWIKLYGSCTLDDLPTDIESFYQNHKEQHYHMLYWKYINEVCPTVLGTTSENSDNDECSLNNSKGLVTDDCVSNFDFLYKYKHFQQANSKLSKAYRAISIMGYIYNDQNMFDTGFVQYLKKNIIKSTRHLNVYRFPKMCATPTFDDNLLSSNSKDCAKSKVKSKKALKKEEWKDIKEKCTIEEMDRLGYSYLKNKPTLMKYWKKRYMLFSKFEKGIKLDEESWYSVTPEIISVHIADRCSCHLIVDPFCGAGSNIIQFAKTCELVIAIDIDPKKIEIARYNAELYGVADRIQFIIGDYFALAPTLKADVVFLSPPWGGPDLMNLEEYKLSYIMPEKGGIKHMMSLTRQITSNIALHLPKNTNIFDCIQSAEDGFIEVQQNILNSRYNSLTIYYSELYGLCDEDTITYNDS
ncbi:trimethylguanosine synthase-like isoform X2 [Rhopalosiphum maidis]|nr:trimethylguanosine synthase-like isoform X2 [Rhopalosiphum maidis]